MKIKGFAKNSTILITGASGFIADRIIEILARDFKRDHLTIICLVHDVRKSSRIARMNVTIRTADILNFKELSTVVGSVDYIIHCAYGTSNDVTLNRKITVNGTRNIIKLAMLRNVKRLVYFSTVNVYGHPSVPVCNETNEYRTVVNDDYTNDKIAAEKLVQAAIKNGLPAVILQPTVVYGPFSKIWTTEVIWQIKTEQLFLVNNGNGLVNPVYIDNVVDATILALTQPQAVGERFIISDGTPIRWKTFYHFYERMLSVNSARSTSRMSSMFVITQATIIQGIRRIKKIIYPKPIFTHGKVRTFVDQKTAQPLTLKSLQADQNQMHFFSLTTTYSIAKARRLLGYSPRTKLKRGMQLTHQWLQYFKYL